MIAGAIGDGEDDDVGSQRQHGVVGGELGDDDGTGGVAGENVVSAGEIGQHGVGVGGGSEDEVGETPRDNRWCGIAHDNGAGERVGVAVSVHGGVSDGVGAERIGVHRAGGGNAHRCAKEVGGGGTGVGEGRAELDVKWVVSAWGDGGWRFVFDNDGVGGEGLIAGAIGDGEDDDVGSQRQHGVVGGELGDDDGTGGVAGENVVSAGEIGQHGVGVGGGSEDEVGETPRDNRWCGIAHDNGAGERVGVAVSVHGGVSDGVGAERIGVHRAGGGNAHWHAKEVGGGGTGINKWATIFHIERICPHRRNGWRSGITDNHSAGGGIGIAVNVHGGVGQNICAEDIGNNGAADRDGNRAATRLGGGRAGISKGVKNLDVKWVAAVQRNNRRSLILDDNSIG